MADIRTTLFVVLYCLWWPVSYIIHAVHTVVAPIWTALTFVFLPVTYLIYAIVTIVLFPFRLNILDRFEVISALTSN
jgi:hypothetical protein